MPTAFPSIAIFEPPRSSWCFSGDSNLVPYPPCIILHYQKYLPMNKYSNPSNLLQPLRGQPRSAMLLHGFTIHEYRLTNPNPSICSSFDLHNVSFHRFNHGFSFIFETIYKLKELFRNCSLRAGGIKPHCAIPQARVCGTVSIPSSLSMISPAREKAPIWLAHVSIINQKSTILIYLSYHYI